MLLSNADTSFRLSVRGYQYPDAAGETYDANWLLIEIEARSPEGEWAGADPCLLTYEAARLSGWLEALAAGKEAAPALSFLEPVLLFRVKVNAQGQKVLRVHFGGLLHPSWAEETHGSTDRWLDFPLADREMLAGAAQELRQELKRYPNRAAF